MNLCIDTNAYVQFRAGNTEVLALLESADTVYVPTVVLGELYAGFFAGTRAKANIADLQEFLRTPGIEDLPVSSAIAERYGLLVAALRRKGRPLPTSDIWIAAAALEHGARLVSYDRHFEAIDGLVVYSP